MGGATLLYETDALSVRAHLGRGSSALCVVVFDPVTDRPALDRPAFAEAYLARLGVDAIHVLSARNDWFQTPALPEALAAVRSRIRGYERVVAYGSSMGGYAALRFSDRIGAHAVIAISPQYSLIQGEAAPDPRWAGVGAGITWIHERLGQPLPPVPDVLLIFDPRNRDRLHAEAILRDLPGAAALRVACAGHPAGAMLAELGLLPSIVAEAAWGRLDLQAASARIRRQRRTHRVGAYFFTLARQQRPARLALKARLMDLAMAAVPGEAAYISYAALLQEQLGRRDLSIALHEATRASDGFGPGHARRALALLRAGRMADAAQAARRALETAPPTSNENRALAAWADQPAEAFRIICNSPWLSGLPWPMSWTRFLRDVPPLRRLIGRLAGRRLSQLLIAHIVSTPAYFAYELAATDNFV